MLTERLIADLSAQDKTGRFESLRTAELRPVSIATVLGQVAYTLPVIAGPSGGCIDDTGQLPAPPMRPLPETITRQSGLAAK